VDSTDHDQRAHRNRAFARTERSGEAGSALSSPSLSPVEDIEAFVNVGRWTLDLLTGALLCSPQLIRIYGLASPSLMPNSDSFLLHTHPSDRMRVRAVVLRAQSTGEPFQFQQRIVRMDDAIRVLRTRGRIERGADGQPLCILGMSQDITEAVVGDEQARQRFRKVTRHSFDREEGDKRRIVTQLRERLAEPLVSLGRRLGALSAEIPALEGEHVATLLEAPTRDINTVATATLQLMGQLRPSVLEDNGLLAALKAEGLRVGRQAAIPVSVSGDEIVPRLPMSVETALFRIGQEALANAVRHSACTLIRVSLTGSAHHARLEIQDNGTGFNAASLAGNEPGGSASGLDLMRERAEAVCATFRLSSQLGGGARLTVEYRG
jgi:signal transduction histidine kinase